MKKVILVVLLSVCAALAADKEFWAHKSYDKWSADECKRMMNDSPWAKSLTLRHAEMRQINREFGDRVRDDNGSGQRQPEVVYTAEIRSALPVRQAYIRLKQIQAHFDSMTGDAKARAQKAFDGYLSQSFDDKIVVMVEYSSNLPDTEQAMQTFWQSQTVATLKNTVYLSGPDGYRVEPIGYVAGGDQHAFQFVFPRNPEYAKAHPDLPLEFEFRETSSVTNTNSASSFTGSNGRMYFKFEPKDMQVDGKVVY